MPFIVLAVATLGLVGPSGSSRYMGFFRELAGSASSVYTTMMFVLGGTFGWLSGVLNDGTLVPVAVDDARGLADGERDQLGSAAAARPRCIARSPGG